MKILGTIEIFKFTIHEYFLLGFKSPKNLAIFIKEKKCELPSSDSM